MDATDEAREYLKTLMGRVYHEYIDEKLAGDFAYDIVKIFKDGAHVCLWLTLMTTVPSGTRNVGTPSDGLRNPGGGRL